jgi:hypothetical protein
VRQRTELQRKVDGLGSGAVSEAGLAARQAELHGAAKELQQLQEREQELQAQHDELAKQVGGRGGARGWGLACAACDVGMGR